MASDPDFVDYACSQMRAAGFMRSKKMFGEFALYCDEILVALICDNQVFLKQTTEARGMIESPVEASPYPGAKPHFVVDEFLDQPEILSALVATTAKCLPAPKPKKKKIQAHARPITG